jgi:lipoprotein-releasing system permease protein
LRLPPNANADLVAARMNQRLLPFYRASSWLETNRDFLWIIQLEKNMLFFVLIFIILVASFAIASSLLNNVVRKTREIGLYGALGAVPRQVAACFCLQGLFIGIVGTALGLALAFVALHFRNDIIQAFARLTQSEAALLRFYQFQEIPAYTAPQDIAVTIICTVAISTLAGVIPAWRAARLRPSEALRNE